MNNVKGVLPTLLGRGIGYLRELCIFYLFGFTNTADEVVTELLTMDASLSVFGYSTLVVAITGVVKLSRKRAMKLSLLLSPFAAVISYCFLLLLPNRGELPLHYYVIYSVVSLPYGILLTERSQRGFNSWYNYTNILMNLPIILALFLWKLDYWYEVILLATIVRTLCLYFVTDNQDDNEFSDLSRFLTKILLSLILLGGYSYLVVFDKFAISEYSGIYILNLLEKLGALAFTLFHVVFILPILPSKKKVSEALYRPVWGQIMLVLLVFLVVSELCKMFFVSEKLEYIHYFIYLLSYFLIGINISLMLAIERRRMVMTYVLVSVIFRLILSNFVRVDFYLTTLGLFSIILIYLVLYGKESFVRHLWRWSRRDN